MDFRLTDEQTMLADMASGLLSAQCASARLRAHIEADDACDDVRWAAIGDAGFFATMAPEDQGGLGLGAVEMALIGMAAGAAALPEPLMEHAGVVVPALAALRADAVVRALEGGYIAVERPSAALAANADMAEAVLLFRGDEAHIAPKAQFAHERVESFDPLRRQFRLTCSVSGDSKIAEGASARAVRDAVFDRGVLFAAAQLVGCARRVVEIAVAYTRDRKQFGKPIGSFQAVKHLLASAQTKVEFARPVVIAAAAAYDFGASIAPMRISHAKIAAADAADFATHAALQVHGAMGYSWETDVHLFLKRALALSNDWGGRAFHMARIAAHTETQPLGPDMTFGACES